MSASTAQLYSCGIQIPDQRSDRSSNASLQCAACVCIVHCAVRFAEGKQIFDKTSLYSISVRASFHSVYLPLASLALLGMGRNDFKLAMPQRDDMSCFTHWGSSADIQGREGFNSTSHRKNPLGGYLPPP